MRNALSGASPFFSFLHLLMLESRDESWTGQSAPQSSIVAAIHVAVLGLLEGSDASGDLRMSPEPGKTAVARNALCFADHPVLCAKEHIRMKELGVSPIPFRDMIRYKVFLVRHLLFGIL